MESGKILKELSDLTKNMDILTRELRSANKINSQTADSLKSVTDKISKDESSSKDASVEIQDSFKGFTESFIKSFESQNKNILDGITKGLDTSISEFAKNIPAQAAKIKSTGIDTVKSAGEKTIENALDKIASKIPGLYQGGIAETDGLAIVGEKGPELVELKKGEKVKTMEDQLLEFELESMKKNKEAVDKLTSTESKFPPFVEDLISKYKSEEGPLTESNLRDYIKKMSVDDPELLTDPDYLKDELDYYKDESSRQVFTKEDLEKLSKPIEESIKNKVDEKKSKVSDKIEKIISPTNIKTPEVLSDKETKTTTAPDSTKSTEGAKPQTDKQKLQSLAEQTKLPVNFDVTKDSLNSFLERNKKYLPKEENKNKPTPSTPEPENEPTPTPTSSVEKKPEPRKEPTSTSQVPQSMDGISKSDVKDIKALLAGIYKAISGPLNVNSDEPFRPNSNYF